MRENYKVKEKDEKRYNELLLSKSITDASTLADYPREIR